MLLVQFMIFIDKRPQNGSSIFWSKLRFANKKIKNLSFPHFLFYFTLFYGLYNKKCDICYVLICTSGEIQGLFSTLIC